MPKTTFEFILPCGEKVEVGDKKDKDFKPHLRLNRWSEECFIKVALPTQAKVLPSVAGDKVKWLDADKEVQFYPLEPKTVIAKDKEGKDRPFNQNELGGFEFEIILKKKPPKNVITLDIETQGLKFYYQPPLTPEEIEEGSVRPDNVVGSYAVYHATRGNAHRSKVDAEKYKCGKAFHIYRPKITDAQGRWIWAELSIDKGTLTITIDQDWLDSAIYPVSIDPTFGYTTKGSASADTSGRLRAAQATLTENGIAETLHYGINNEGYSPGHIRMAIYDESASKPNALQVESAIVEVPYLTDDFVTVDITDTELSAAVYWLAWQSQEAMWTYYDSGSGLRSTRDFVWAAFPNPYGASSTGVYMYSIYCTYSLAGATYTKTVDIDALLKATDTKTVAADTLLKGIDTETIDLDALLRQTDTEVLSIDALLKARGTETVDLDVLLQALGITKTAAIDALLRATDTEAVNLDVLVKKLGITKTVALDVILGLFAQMVELDTLLKGSGTETVDMDTLLKGVDTKAVDIDILLALVKLTKSVTLDTFLGETDSKSVDLDTYLRALDIIATVNLDTLIRELGITKAVALDVLLEEINLETVDLDILLRALGVTKTVVLDVILGGISRITIALDIILLKPLAPELIYTVEIRNPDGELIAILERVHGIGYSQLVNAPHVLRFALPATDNKVSNIILANEFWLRDNRTGLVVRKFKLERKMDIRQ